MSLEKFLKGEPINEEMARLRRAVEDGDEDVESVADQRRKDAGDAPITDIEREYIRVLLTTPGWQVLLKLLDSDLQAQEDAARRSSLQSPLARSTEIAEMWADVAAAKKARRDLLVLAEAEVKKLKKTKKKRAN